MSQKAEFDLSPINAPGFAPEQFARALHRAIADGVRLYPSEVPREVIAINPSTGARYRVTRTSCTCDAGQHGAPCKHRALAIFSHDILHAYVSKEGAQ